MENQNNQQEQQLVQKKQNQKKNALFGIVTLLIVAVIGGTIAYFSSTASFVNEFETATYKTVTTEVFESPDNWTPGETIPKTIATTNEGSIPVAVRVIYTEVWEDLEGNTVQSPANAVTINFDNTTEWTKEENYYYYNYKLNPNETTSSFISGVTLNDTASTVTCTPSQDGKTQTCEATDPALGKKYKLTITTETIQFDSYEDVWNTNVEIIDKPVTPSNPYETDFSGNYTYQDYNRVWQSTVPEGDAYLRKNTDTNALESCAVLGNNTVCIGKVQFDCNPQYNSGTESYECQNTTGYVYYKMQELEQKGATCTVGYLSGSDSYYFSCYNGDSVGCSAHSDGYYLCGGDYSTTCYMWDSGNDYCD